MYKFVHSTCIHLKTQVQEMMEEEDGPDFNFIIYNLKALAIDNLMSWECWGENNKILFTLKEPNNMLVNLRLYIDEIMI
jgi:hypothetical protein